MKSMRIGVFVILFLMFSGPALAEPDPRLIQLEAALNQVQQEQQSLYQQFQMTQELRRNVLQDIAPTIMQSYSVVGVDSARALDYNENVRLQRERLERLEQYDSDMNKAYARFLELSNQKKLLLDQIVELSQTTKP